MLVDEVHRRQAVEGQTEAWGGLSGDALGAAENEDMDVGMTVWTMKAVRSGLMERTFMTFVLQNSDLVKAVTKSADSVGLLLEHGLSETAPPIPLLASSISQISHMGSLITASANGISSTSTLTKAALANGQVEIPEVNALEQNFKTFRDSGAKQHVYILGATNHWVSIMARKFLRVSEGIAELQEHVEFLVFESFNTNSVLSASDAELQMACAAEAEGHRNHFRHKINNDPAWRQDLHLRYTLRHRGVEVPPFGSELDEPAITKLLQFKFEETVMNDLSPLLDVRFALNTLRLCLLGSERGTEATEEAMTLHEVYITELVSNVIGTFAAKAAGDCPIVPGELQIPKLERAESSVGLEYWLESYYHPAQFERNFLGVLKALGVKNIPAKVLDDLQRWARDVRLAVLVCEDPSPLVQRFVDAMNDLAALVQLDE